MFMESKQATQPRVPSPDFVALRVLAAVDRAGTRVPGQPTGAEGTRVLALIHWRCSAGADTRAPRRRTGTERSSDILASTRRVDRIRRFRAQGAQAAAERVARHGLLPASIPW